MKRKREVLQSRIDDQSREHFVRRVVIKFIQAKDNRESFFIQEKLCRRLTQKNMEVESKEWSTEQSTTRPSRKCMVLRMKT